MTTATKKSFTARLKELDKGVFVSHETVMTWLKKRVKIGKWATTPKPDVFLKKVDMKYRYKILKS